MSRLTLSELFDAPASPITPLTRDQEDALVVQAQAGDAAANDALLRAFLPAIRYAASRVSRRDGGTIDRDERRSNVLLAFAEAIEAATPAFPLRASFKGLVQQVADDFTIIGQVTIPTRTAQRFYQAKRLADGDPTKAEAEAVKLGMTVEVYRAVSDALNSWDSYEVVVEGTMDRADPIFQRGRGVDAANASGLWASADEASVDDQHLVAQAFAAVDEPTGAILKDAYGFTEYEPIPDAEIAHRRGISRSAVQRIRTKGLGAMHDAIHEGNEDRCQRAECQPMTDLDAWDHDRGVGVPE